MAEDGEEVPEIIAVCAAGAAGGMGLEVADPPGGTVARAYFDDFKWEAITGGTIDSVIMGTTI